MKDNVISRRREKALHTGSVPLLSFPVPFYLFLLCMSSAAPQISGKGCEDSTVSGNESALKFLNGFMTYLLNGKHRAHAVDDQDSTVGVDLQEIAETGGIASSSGAGESTIVSLSLKELVTFHLPQLTTRLFWGQFAYYATFTAEKKSGDAYAHGTAKGYFNAGIRLVRECEDPPLSEAAKAFFVDAMKSKSWLKNIQAKMQRHFAKRAAQEGMMLVTKAPPVALKQVAAASSDLGEESEQEDPKLKAGDEGLDGPRDPEDHVGEGGGGVCKALGDPRGQAQDLERGDPGLPGPLPLRCGPDAVEVS